MLPLASQLDIELRKLIKPDQFDKWMDTPNVKLEMKTPGDMLARKKFQPLWNLIYRMRHMDGEA